MFRKYIKVPYWKWCLRNNQKDIDELESFKKCCFLNEDKREIDFDIRELRDCNAYLIQRIEND